MKHVIISPRARREIERIDSRWVKNRPAATDLFYSEFREIVDLLRHQPYLGHIYPPKDGVRRILLRASQYHVYYEIDSNHVAILSVWSAVRGRGPKL